MASFCSAKRKKVWKILLWLPCHACLNDKLCSLRIEVTLFPLTILYSSRSICTYTLCSHLVGYSDGFFDTRAHRSIPTANPCT
ncbi:hypothetical protein BDV41DRAFT_124286 [Aspergillus transmontanensis]|uniref:Secreted protein n=1 Tax=Aspergillus transmontanensis TaxID=1034304 RepID=A0A5N6W7C6_9EURO|nr:hypothetical protein BDV41DRAFT_124286 [Aspergillus transmontanensis]